MKYYLLLFTLFVCVFANAQALIVATDLDLKNPEHKQQFLQVKHPDSNEFFVFASDKTDFYALRFNSALFYRDSLKIARPANDVDFLAGSSFDAKGNPATYWVSEDYSTIRATIFDFESRLINTALFKIDYKEQYFIGSFSTDGKFYIITTREDQDRLNFYVFTAGLMHESSVALGIALRNEQNQISFGKLLAQYPPEHIDNRLLTPLFYATPKIKFYTSNNKLLFTFDHELHQTQVVSVDLDSFESASSAIPNETLTSGPGDSNSFVSGELLYQLKANDTEIRISVKELSTGIQKNSFGALIDGDMTSLNSPLLIQTGSQPAREVRNHKRFFKMLSAADIGISVHNNSYPILVTVGGVDYIPSTGNVILGIAAGAGMVMGGADVDLSGLIANDNLRTVFFEITLDDALKPVHDGQPILAADKVQTFLQQEDERINSILTKYNQDFLLGYYSSRQKKYILRRFFDGQDF